MKMYLTSDGWPFYLQPDGSLTDTPDPNNCDLGYDNIEQMFAWDDEAREATLTERKHAARIRYQHKKGIEDNYDI